MTPLYAIGDVHGHFEKLADAFELIERDGGPDARVILLGDLVDRGPDSFGVVELLRLGVAEGRNWTVIRGNHDQMFLDFVTRGVTTHERIKSGKSWMHPDLGGKTTLASYGVNPDLALRQILRQTRELVPQAHLDFIAELPLMCQDDDYVFVHAGIAPGVPLDEQDFDDLIWIREPFLSHADPHERIVVHGHTALKTPQRYSNRINLDGGAGYGRDLSIGVFEGDEVCLLTSQGRAIL
ncbi:MAG: serine/threonine protein phosphatase [Marinovum sp.]|nr:serine/threonine protein phosphatase [Marinovum sp.]